MRNTILGTLFICLLASCQKSDPPPTVAYGAKYVKSGTSRPSAIKVFTTSGEIRNASITQRINDYDSAYASYGAENLARNPQGFLDTLTFTSNSIATISAYYQRTIYTVTQENGAYLLTSQDTLNGFISGVEMSRNVQYFLPNPRRALYSETLSGVSQGVYFFNYRFQDKLKVQAGGGQDLDIPILLYSWYKSGNIYARDFIPGTTDPKFYTNIPDGDTVAVREYAFHFTK